MTDQNQAQLPPCRWTRIAELPKDVYETPDADTHILVAECTSPKYAETIVAALEAWSRRAEAAIEGQALPDIMERVASLVKVSHDEVSDSYNRALDDVIRIMQNALAVSASSAAEPWRIERARQAESSAAASAVKVEDGKCAGHCEHGLGWMRDGRCLFRESIDADFCFHRCDFSRPTPDDNARARRIAELVERLNHAETRVAELERRNIFAPNSVELSERIAREIAAQFPQVENELSEQEAVASLATTIDSHLQEIWNEAISLIPTNWADPLLSGKDSPLHGPAGTWNCQDIERLLLALKTRLEAARDAKGEKPDA